jgi:PKD repeat protein
MAITDTATHTYTQPGTYHGTLTVANTDKSSVSNFTIVVLSDKPGYYIINGKYYRPGAWVNDLDGVTGRISVITAQNSFLVNSIGFYFYGADNATAGQYSTTYDYINNIHPGQVSAGMSLDSGHTSYGASASNIAKVTLELLPAGKRHISGADIWMVEYPNRTDSFKVSFDLREP